MFGSVSVYLTIGLRRNFNKISLEKVENQWGGAGQEAVTEANPSEADAVEEVFDEALVNERKKPKREVLRLHAEEVAIVDGLLQCLGSGRISTFGLRRNFRRKPRRR